MKKSLYFLSLAAVLVITHQTTQASHEEFQKANTLDGAAKILGIRPDADTRVIKAALDVANAKTPPNQYGQTAANVAAHRLLQSTFEERNAYTTTAHPLTSLEIEQNQALTPDGAAHALRVKIDATDEEIAKAKRSALLAGQNAITVTIAATQLLIIPYEARLQIHQKNILCYSAPNQPSKRPAISDTFNQPTTTAAVRTSTSVQPEKQPVAFATSATQQLKNFFIELGRSIRNHPLVTKIMGKPAPQSIFARPEPTTSLAANATSPAAPHKSSLPKQRYSPRSIDRHLYDGGVSISQAHRPSARNKPQPESLQIPKPTELPLTKEQAQLHNTVVALNAKIQSLSQQSEPLSQSELQEVTQAHHALSQNEWANMAPQTKTMLNQTIAPLLDLKSLQSTAAQAKLHNTVVALNAKIQDLTTKLTQKSTSVSRQEIQEVTQAHHDLLNSSAWPNMAQQTKALMNQISDPLKKLEALTPTAPSTSEEIALHADVMKLHNRMEDATPFTPQERNQTKIEYQRLLSSKQFAKMAPDTKTIMIQMPNPR